MQSNWFQQTKIAQANLNNILIALHNNKIDDQMALQQLKIINIDPSIFCEEIINYANRNNSTRVMQLYNNLGCANQINVDHSGTQQPEPPQEEVPQEI